jgi:glutamate-1-semialdehyde 2,1-aminomutase
MGINNVLIGHAESDIDEAAISAIRNGQNFSRPSVLEIEAAEAVLSLFPQMEMIKFAKNGSDANTAAIRLARAITGRDLIAYDGSAPFISIHDWFIGTTQVAAGVPDVVRRLSVPFAYNDPHSIERLFAEHPGQIACVIMEVCRETKPRLGFLETVRRLCTQNGALLIFDEVVTAFRYSLHGAHTTFGVTPDLMSLGKGMANGYALTALAGKREFMERGGLFHHEPRVFLMSTTNGAEQSALAAGKATVEFYKQHDVFTQIYRTGQKVIDGLNAAAARYGIGEYLIAGGDFSCRPTIQHFGPDKTLSPEYRTLFMQEMMRNGVFMIWTCVAFRHGDSEVDQTLDAFDTACAVYAKALDARSTQTFLVGPAAKPVFRRYN